MILSGDTEKRPHISVFVIGLGGIMQGMLTMVVFGVILSYMNPSSASATCGAI